MKKIIQSIALAGAMLAAQTPGQAQMWQAWPTRPVRIIVPAAAGGPNDVIARIISEEISSILGQGFWIENRAGAGQVIGMTAGATADPDGYSFLIVSTPYVTAPLLQPVRYAPSDLQPVILLTTAPYLLVVAKDLPANSVQDLVNLARAKPGDLNMSTPGGNTGPHLTGELFRKAANIDIKHVPYRGGPESESAIMRGEASFLFGSISLLSQIEAGTMRVLAVTSARRSPLAPALPTVAESGFAGFDSEVWNGMLAPAGVSPQIIAKLSSALNEALGRPQVKKRFAELGFTPVGGSPKEFGDLIVGEGKKWRVLIEATGLKPN